MQIPTIDLEQTLHVLSGGLDLVGVDDVHHGKRTARMALRIAERLGFDAPGRRDLTHAALIHDLGVSTTTAHGSLIHGEWDDVQEHCDRGAERIREFPPLAHLASVIRHHHTPWSALPRASVRARDALLANVIFLCDRADAVRARRTLAGDPDANAAAREAIAAASGESFDPELVRHFLAASAESPFFAGLAPEPLERWFAERLASTRSPAVAGADLRRVGRLFAHVVDAKSPFTARHSEGVASLACWLASLIGLDAAQVAIIEVAALLHDIGKLRVPDHILDKPGPLDPGEWLVMRRHVKDSYDLLRRIEGFGEVATWAALHHERPSGDGYPESLRSAELPLPARIISVADVFQALAQARPYRPGLPAPEILAILEAEARADHLDAGVVTVVAANLDSCWLAAVNGGRA